MKLVVAIFAIAPLVASADVTLSTEWRDVPDTNTVGSILNLGPYNATNAANWAIGQYDSTNLASRISAKYTKPQTGIPMSDLKTDLQQTIYGKQDQLVAGTNIKTVNNQSILGSGNIVIEGTGGTMNYNALNNKPKVNGVELTGNKSSSDLGIVVDVSGKRDLTNNVCAATSATFGAWSRDNLPSGVTWASQPVYDASIDLWEWSYDSGSALSEEGGADATSLTFGYGEGFASTRTGIPIALSNDVFTTYAFVTNAMAHAAADLSAATNYTDSATNATLAAAKADAAGKYLPLTGGMVNGSLIVTDGEVFQVGNNSLSTNGLYIYRGSVYVYGKIEIGSSDPATYYDEAGIYNGGPGVYFDLPTRGSVIASDYLVKQYVESSSLTNGGAKAYADATFAPTSTAVTVSALVATSATHTTYLAVTNIVNGLADYAVTTSVTNAVDTAMTDLLGSNWRTTYGGGLAGVLAAIFAAIAVLNRKKVGSFAAVGGQTPTVTNGVADVTSLFSSANTSLKTAVQEIVDDYYDDATTTSYPTSAS